MPGAIALAVALNQTVQVRGAGLRGKIVHLVVQEKAGAGRDHLGAEIAVDRIGHGDCIAGAVDDRIMGRLRLLVRGSERRGGWRLARPHCGADPGRIALRQQPVERVRYKGRVAEKGVAVGVGAAHRLDHQFHRARRAQAQRLHVIAFEDVEDLADRGAARTRRRRRHDRIAAVGARERRPLARRCNRQNRARSGFRHWPGSPWRRQRRPALCKRRPALSSRSPRASPRDLFARDGRRA